MTASYNDFRIHLSASTPGKVSVAQGKGAVASVSKQATELAVAVLQSGGNAFDAAFSLAFSLCVSHPQAGNIGGGGYLLFKVKGESQPKVFNYREQSPAHATREAFLLPDGSPDANKTAYGPTSVCVPGTVKAFFTLQQRYGRLLAKDLLLAIAKRAQEGAYVTRYEADCLNRLAPRLKISPEFDWGVWSGRPFDGAIEKEVSELRARWRAGETELSPVGGESPAHAAVRADRFLARLHASKAHAPLVVAHGRFNRILMTRLLGRELGRMDEIRQRNGSLSAFEWDGSAPATPLLLDDVSHLPSKIQTVSVLSDSVK